MEIATSRSASPVRTEHTSRSDDSEMWDVLEAGLEPAQAQCPRDFKSLVSTDSTIRASSTGRTENETRTRTPALRQGGVLLAELFPQRFGRGQR